MQQMSSEEPLVDQTERRYRGYQEEPERHQERYMDFHEALSQSKVKIQASTSSKPTARQRMVLAIVSAGVIGLLGIILGGNIHAVFALGMVALTILLINGFFNRWGIF